MATRAFELEGLVNIDVKDAVNNLKKLDGKVNNTGKTTDGFISKLKNLGKVVVGAFAVKAVVDFGKKCVDLASDLDEVQNVVDVTFGEGTETINKFAKDAATNFGMSELQAKKFTGTMGAMTKSMGLTSDESLKMSTDLTGLAGDMASFYNLDHEEAFNKIRAGISGETEPLKQLGINMSVANLEAYALAQGISKPYKEMSQSEQTMLRYNYLMNATKDAQGDFNRTSDGFANQLRIAKLNIENVAGSIGKLLLPFVNKLITGFNGIITKVMDFGTKISEGFGIFKKELDASGEFTWAFGEMIENIFGIKFPTTFYWMVESIIGFFQQLWLVLTSIWETVGVPIVDMIKSAFTGLGENSQSIFVFISDAFDLMAQYIKTVWESVGQPIMDFIMMAIGLVRDAFAERMPQIQAFFRTAITDIKSVWENNLKPCFEAIGNFISNVLAPAFKFVFQNIILPVVDSVFHGIGNLWSNSLKPIFQGIINFITGVFSGDWSKAWSGIVNTLGGIFSGIATVVKAPLNAVIALINRAIDGVNSLSVDIPDWVPFVGGNSFGVNIPKMNYLENGGILTQPTLLSGNVMAGEKNKGRSAQTEVVVPLDDLKLWITELSNRAVKVIVNGKEMMSAVADDADSVNGRRLMLTNRGVLV